MLALYDPLGRSMTTALIRRPSLDTVIEWTRPSSARRRPASKLVRRDTVRRIAASSGSRPAAAVGEGEGGGGTTGGHRRQCGDLHRPEPVRTAGGRDMVSHGPAP